MTIKLTVMLSTKTLSEKLDRPPPDLSSCEVWIVAMSRNIGERMPSVCQMPEMAKNKSSGAKIQPRYKWMERSFCMGLIRQRMRWIASARLRYGIFCPL